MGIITAIAIIIASVYMWGDMLYDIISLHFTECKIIKRRKIIYDEYTK